MSLKLRHILSLMFLFLFFANTAWSQELNCTVEVNSDQVQGTNKQVFNTLKEAISQYMNENHFTNAQYAANEKIDCQLYFTIKEQNDNTFSGDLQIQATRPVYNSSYITTLINFKDSKIEFDYQENEPLIFSPSTFESQLTAILNYYAYLILAIDSDSFQLNGGDPYYQAMEQIVQMGQSSGETGWKAFEDSKNRAAVLAAYTEPSTSAIRDLLYQYHRRGLDEMSVSPDKGRQTIAKSLEDIQKVYDGNSMSVALSMFKDAKMDELVNVFSKGTQEERKNAYDLLSPIYPTEMDRINKIRDGQTK
ncbi:MAG: DUF4835 family protein [Muribaculaceae bacterium]|nr:DUF4835 family protein [Muribaculaceae bacterium]